MLPYKKGKEHGKKLKEDSAVK